MMPLQRPPGMPPPHMQRFPIAPPRPGMPPQMMSPRGPPQIMHREPPPGVFSMPPPHTMRGPFPPTGPPFMRASGPRMPDGPEDHEGRPFRVERPGQGRDRDQEWYGGRRPFSDGRSRDRSEGRERFGSWHEEAEQRGGWERARERRDWRRSPDGERDRDREREQGREGEERSKRREREPGVRERSTRWDRDDRLDRLANMSSQPNGHETLRDTSNSEHSADPAKELTPVGPEAPPPSTEATAETEASVSTEENQKQPAEVTKADES